jgi:hypothetical protein
LSGVVLVHVGEGTGQCLGKAVVASLLVVAQADLVPPLMESRDDDRRGDGLACFVGGLDAAKLASLRIPAVGVECTITLGFVAIAMAGDCLGPGPRTANVSVSVDIDGSHRSERACKQRGVHNEASRGTAG